MNIGGTHIPLSDVILRAELFQKDIPVIVFCKTGQRSRQAILKLQKDFGFKNLLSMKGGLDQWRKEVDPGMVGY